ncbi:hypothetical protein OROGR_010676 [Orobanche gracilis]
MNVVLGMLSGAARALIRVFLHLNLARRLLYLETFLQPTFNYLEAGAHKFLLVGFVYRLLWFEENRDIEIMQDVR